MLAPARLPIASHIQRGIILRLARVGGMVCAYCRVEVTAERGRQQATVDHALPHSRGGADEMANFRLACRRCNSAKGDLTEAEYRAYLRVREIEAAPSRPWDKRAERLREATAAYYRLRADGLEAEAARLRQLADPPVTQESRR